MPDPLSHRVTEQQKIVGTSGQALCREFWCVLQLWHCPGSHNTHEWRERQCFCRCRLLDTNKWGEWRHLEGSHVLAVLGVMVRNFGPCGDDCVFCAERDRLYLIQWNSRFDPHSNLIPRTIRGDRVAQGVIGCDPPDGD
jgi:hypothetical protein